VKFLILFKKAIIIDFNNTMKTIEDIKDNISELFKKFTLSKDNKELDIIPEEILSGKLYEAFVLGNIAKKLVEEEGLFLVLANGNYLNLKSSPGKINNKYPRIDVYRNKAEYERKAFKIAVIWTDIEFLSLSYHNDRNASPLKPGDYHELDILMVTPYANARPNPEQILLGVECKNTASTKKILKEILGIRRELSFLNPHQPTFFKKWPRNYVNAKPSSCLLLYSTDENINNFSSPGEFFGIDFMHLEMKN